MRKIRCAVCLGVFISERMEFFNLMSVTYANNIFASLHTPQAQLPHCKTRAHSKYWLPGIHETEEKLVNYLGKRTNKLNVPRRFCARFCLLILCLGDYIVHNFLSSNLTLLSRCLLDAFNRRAFSERSSTSTPLEIKTDVNAAPGQTGEPNLSGPTEHDSNLLRVGAHVYPKFRNGR